MCLPSATALAISGNYPGTCFPDRSLPLPDPTNDEPFLATGFIDLKKTLSYSSYTYSVYRHACPGGGAVVLIKLKSQGIPTGEAPVISLIQGSTTINEVFYSREPYTEQEGVKPSEDIHFGGVFVMNNYSIDHTKAMTLRISGHSNVTVEVPVFDPTMYPEANESLPIIGNVSGHFFDPEFPGEGMFVEIEPHGLILVALYTYYPDGRPLWLVGAGEVCRQVACMRPPTVTEVLLQATSGGGFLGDFDDSSVVLKDWGTLGLEWKTCSQLKVTFKATHSDPDLPTKDIERIWARINTVQGNSCL